MAHDLTPVGYRSTLPPVAYRYLMVRSLLEMLSAAFVAALAIVILIPAEWRMFASLCAAMTLLLAILIEIPLINRLVVKYTSYDVTDQSVRISRGLLVRHDTVISTPQILHITIITGPILRRHGLAKLHFATISGRIVLGPVAEGEAEVIRARVMSGFDPHRESL